MTASSIDTRQPFSIQIIDSLSPHGLEYFNNQGPFNLAKNTEQPHAIILRSTNLHDYMFPDSVEILGRAGAGTNNIPVDTLTSRGIPVLNTPGANANAVKELALAGLLLSSRKICSAWEYVQSLPNNDQLSTTIEANKKQFTGTELPGKTLGVIGLGKIGVNVANAANHLGMRVLGFDPAISVQNAWQLNSQVEQINSLTELLQQVDFLTLHIPLTKETTHFINQERINSMKKSAVILNFSRANIVDHTAIKSALDNNTLQCYVSDFPNTVLHNHPNTITLPHLGASTQEAQDNCARMIASQVHDYLINGTITHSVNFPTIQMKRNTGYRISITNRNIPNMVAQVSSVLSENGLNILEMINQSRNDIAYNLIDIDQPIQQQQLNALQAIDGILRIRNLD
ncbi:MAG: 3-phosphoglycerate dehydrogenase [Coxiellaceae bacterium]|nr:3-phosphoglycerate dehydrogenase [Coxiellaceae bacterium]|tara:strand:+ start:3595 stop:4791 length:1197 start_codon:yes stop_codon:yes gene_type:complete